MARGDGSDRRSSFERLFDGCRAAGFGVRLEIEPLPEYASTLPRSRRARLKVLVKNDVDVFKESGWVEAGAPLEGASSALLKLLTEAGYIA